MKMIAIWVVFYPTWAPAKYFSGQWKHAQSGTREAKVDLKSSNLESRRRLRRLSSQRCQETVRHFVNDRHQGVVYLPKMGLN